MLSEVQVKLLRAALRMLPHEQGRMAVGALSIVLEEVPDQEPVSLTGGSGVPQSAPAEKTVDQRQIEDLQSALTATRERAEKAEQKYVELKRNMWS